MTKAVSIQQGLKATPAKVYAAFVDPVLLSRWFFPESYTVLEGYLEDRQGGKFHVRVRDESGKLLEINGDVLHAERPHRIVFTWKWSAPEYGDQLTTVEVSIEATSHGSLLSIIHSPMAEPVHQMHLSGWQTAVMRLAAIMGESDSA